MRAWQIVVALALVVICSTAGFAQGIFVPREPASRSPAWRVGGADPATDSKADPFRRLAERLRPLHDRLTQDDRIRTAETLVGLGAVAFGASRGRPQTSLIVVGGQALRLGLHRQLATIRQRSGFAVEPSFGHRSFAVTFRRTFD